jgi:hypothetical protein
VACLRIDANARYADTCCRGRQHTHESVRNSVHLRYAYSRRNRFRRPSIALRLDRTPGFCSSEIRQVSTEFEQTSRCIQPSI